MSQSPTIYGAPVGLESVLCTEELNRRPSRPPDYGRENRALVALTRALADSPGTILQALADAILNVVDCDSSGVSLLTEDGTRFYWPAIAGVWTPHIGGGTPRDFGPCGDVLDRNRPLLFTHFERRYTYFQPVTPLVEECLLVPFYLGVKAVGTIWAIAHDDRRKFDAEDLRVLTSLGTFASAGYQAAAQLQAIEVQDTARQGAAKVLRETNEALVLSGVRQHELAEIAETLNARLHAALKEREYFIGVLSHELRTPLAPVLLAASMLRLDERLDEDTRGIMEMVHRNVQLEARLIDDLLDMTRMERGKLKLDRRPIDLRRVVEHAVEVCRADLEAGELAVEVDTGDEPQIVEADAGRLQQVFSNLLRNSVKFTPAGGRVRVRSRCESDTCTVAVSDSGSGIDPGFLPRAFSAFEQGDKPHARKAGLGLGLAISKTIVDLHGGVITAQSEGKDRGATFLVRLPTMVGVHSVAEGETAAPDKPRPIRPVRVLLVEDQVDTARIMRRLLMADGHEVQWAGNVAAGLELAAAHEFDLLLCDLGLPDGNGIDLMCTLRRSGSTMPGIVLSGYGQDQDIARSREAGFIAHLVKPLELPQLRKAIFAATG